MFQYIKLKPHFIDSNENNGNGQVYQCGKYVQEAEPNLLTEIEYEIEYYFWHISTNFVIVCVQLCVCVCTYNVPEHHINNSYYLLLILLIIDY